MTDLGSRMREEKALRDAARALVEADLAHLKTNLGAMSLTERMFARVSSGAAEVFEEAVEVADNNRGVLATLLAAVALWFARHPIMALFGEETEDDVGSGQSIHGTVNTDE